jgi:hypothetical protein
MPAVIVVAVLAALYGLATAGQSVPVPARQPAGPPRSVPVAAVERGCPGLALAGGSSGRIALIAAPGTAGRGRAVVTTLSPADGASPLLTATRAGQLALGSAAAGGPAPAAAGHAARPASGQAVTTMPQAGGVVVRATGAMARGLAVAQTGPGGIPAAACTSPGTDFWFVGPGQYGAGQIRLYLMNPADQAADVSVEIATDAGPLQGGADMGIPVAPHSMVVQSLEPAVPGSRVVSLHVRTSVGQVVAGLRDTAGATGGGWLPAAQAPATHVIIPGLPATAGTRQLFLAVPGQQDAHVTITAVTSRGTYEPTGGGGIDVPGGSAIAIGLPSLAGIPAALKLTASGPVTASVMIPGGPAGSPGAFTAAAPPLREQGVVAVSLAGGARSSALVLSAPRGRASVRVTELAGSSGPAQTVTVKAGWSQLVRLPPVPGAPHGAPFSVLITPLAGSGPVYAGQVVQSAGTGTVQALMPVASALTTVPLPPVQAAPIISAP